MSADRWSACPRCAHRRAEEIQVARHQLNAAYGDVRLDEFDSMRAAVDALIAKRPDDSLREDYEFYGVEDGELGISYSCNCHACDFSFKYESTMPMPVLPIVAPR